MRKNVKKRHTRLKAILALVLNFVLIFSALNFTDIGISKTYAAGTANISISQASGLVGENVTISVTVSASEEVYATQLYLSYDSSIVEYKSGSADTSGGGTIGMINTDTYTSKTFSFTFEIKAVGSSKISVVGNTRLINGDESDITVSSSTGSITGKAPVSYSSDNTLKSLTISPGVLSPAFSSSTTYYTTSVDADVEKLIVNAVANDSNATVTVKYANLDPGSNTTYIIVTAQDGSTKTYTIATTRGSSTEQESETESETTTESENITELEVVIDNARYKIVNDVESYPFPDGYTSIAYSDYEGVTVRAGKSETTGLVLMYLENLDNTQSSGFFIYDIKTSKFYRYNEVAQPQLDYVILPLSMAYATVPDLIITTGNINGQEVECYTDSDRTFFVFYGIDSNGNQGFYKYLISDGTIQAYDSDSVVASDTDIVGNVNVSDKVSKVYKWYFYLAVLVATVILLASLMIIIIQSKKLKKLYACVDAIPDDVLENINMERSNDDLQEDNVDLNNYIESSDDAIDLEVEEIELNELEPKDIDKE